MSSYVDVTASAIEHCEMMSRSHPDLSEEYYDPIATYCKQKLWHQLTLTILDMVSPGNASRTLRASATGGGGVGGAGGGNNSFLSLYDKVVLAVDSKFNPLSLARIASCVASSLAPTDMTAAKAVLENLLTKSDTIGSAATVYVQSKLNLLSLRTMLLEKTGDEGGGDGVVKSPEDASKSTTAGREQQLSSIYSTIQKNEKKITDEFAAGSGLTSDQHFVCAAHYEQSMTYYKVVGPPEAFYEQAMNFLNYAPPPTNAAAAATAVKTTGGDDDGETKALLYYGVTDYYQLAIDLCLAALTGDGVYNLGQLIEQTNMLLTLLENTPDSWIAELLHCVSRGDVTNFHHLVDVKYATNVRGQPVLIHRANAVREKLTLLSLVNLIFSKPSNERTVSFEEIASHLQMPDVDQVEYVVMRALSVHLLEGHMDQVDRTVTVTWVMPRILSIQQMSDLATRFAAWANQVNTTREYMKQQTPTFA